MPKVKFLNVYDGIGGIAKYRAATSLVDTGSQVELTSHVGFPDFILNDPTKIDGIEEIDLKSHSKATDSRS